MSQYSTRIITIHVVVARIRSIYFVLCEKDEDSKQTVKEKDRAGRAGAACERSKPNNEN